MKKRDLIGRTIVDVEQSFFVDNVGGDWVVNRLVLSGGTSVRFVVLEGDGEYGVKGIVSKWRDPKAAAPCE